MNPEPETSRTRTRLQLLIPTCPTWAQKVDLDSLLRGSTLDLRQKCENFPVRLFKVASIFKLPLLSNLLFKDIIEVKETMENCQFQNSQGNINPQNREKPQAPGA
ncbi:hypothetical protein DUI87_25657 [Hirundo rustica rustica]|uniref:Uncharacterized protein n=1 Tax=Hirundo rustica rustica TaxID=333673 RepID=A0A3M0JC10_HIRRU|nr:hypothetical protein DUI87_25657 [Hirundo rustica rustica]